MDPWGAQRAMREGALNLAAARALRLESSAGTVPAIILHGTADDVVNRRNADLLVRQFLGWNGYFPSAADWDHAALPPVADAQLKTPYGHPYILRDYGQPGRAPVRECEVVGMGHAWSGGDGAVRFHDELGPDASALMVEFFAGVN
jgi:poly(3-hydroxybutyrate) depolymerase